MKITCPQPCPEQELTAAKSLRIYALSRKTTLQNQIEAPSEKHEMFGLRYYSILCHITLNTTVLYCIVA